MLRDGDRAEFVPIKIGIAGDKYFEVLSGLSDGDQVITGPYNSVREIGDGDQVQVDAAAQLGAQPAMSGHDPLHQSSNRPRIALDAIWANKLRSFMTVLGNIVAVTSIIAVVSLIQGLNAAVQDAILNQARRRLVQHPAVPRHDGATRTSSRCAATPHHARRTRRPSAATARSHGGDARVERQSAASPTATSRSTTRACRASRPEYVDFSSFDAERGRLMSPIEVDRSRPVAVLGWQTADRLFGGRRSRSTRSSRSKASISGWSASARSEGSFFGQSQDEFAIIPLGQFQTLFGVAAAARRSR